MTGQIARYVAILFTAVLLLPPVAFGQTIQITEIMYDLDGTDADREWIEVHNTSGSSIDLNDWHFKENDVNHLLNPAEDGGDTVLSADAYAVIADDPDAFFADHANVSALVLDSSFGLSNTGEELAITDADEAVINEVTYDPDIGAGGTGNSLQLTGGNWIAADPTPGEANATEAADEDDDDSSGSEGDYDIDIMDPRSEPSDSVDDIEIDAGDDIPALAGLAVDIRGEVDGVSDHVMDTLDFHWSLGNGDTATTRQTRYVYEYPGTYVATFRVTTDEGEVYTDATVVEVLEPAVTISAVGTGDDAYIQLENDTGRPVDLAGWSLSDGDDVFTFPVHTIHLDGEQLTITADVSGLSTSDIDLRYPDGRLAHSYVEEEGDEQTGITHTPTTQRTYAPPANTTESEQSVDKATGGENESGQVQGSSTTTTDTSISLDDAFATGDQAAAAMMATRNGGNTDTLWQWAGVLFLLLLITVGTAILMRRVSRPADSPLVQASKFNINQIGEDTDKT
ncbi:MAG: lamin tail domain-containing protein [Candidatus Paceibacterota bacterium]